MTSSLSDPVAVRLPVDVLGSIDELAAALDRKRSWVIVRALKAYLNGEGRYLLDLAAAREEARTAPPIDGDDLLAILNDDMPLYGAAKR